MHPVVTEAPAGARSETRSGAAAGESWHMICRSWPVFVGIWACHSRGQPQGNAAPLHESNFVHEVRPRTLPWIDFSPYVLRQGTDLKCRTVAKGWSFSGFGVPDGPVSRGRLREFFKRGILSKVPEGRIPKAGVPVCQVPNIRPVKMVGIE